MVAWLCAGRGGAVAVVNKHDGGESQPGKKEIDVVISPPFNLNSPLKLLWRISCCVGIILVWVLMGNGIKNLKT